MRCGKRVKRTQGLRPDPLALALAMTLATLSLPSAAVGFGPSPGAGPDAGATGGPGPNDTAAADAVSDAAFDANYDPFAGFDESVGGAPADSQDDDPVYRDRIINADSLDPLPIGDDDEPLSGPPRALHIEALVHRARIAGEQITETGLAAGGFWETANYGTLSAAALLFRGDSGQRNDDPRWRGSATLWQRGLAVRGGWSLDNGLGVLNTPMPPLLRDQYRFFLPSVPMLGASTEWRQRERGLQFQAAAGRGGIYSGTRLNGFDFGDGLVATVGAQWRGSPQREGAASLLVTDGRIVPGDRGLPTFQNGATRSLLIGERWQGARDSVSLQVLGSHSDAGGAVGAWVDARANRGRMTHRYGAFQLGSDLAWGAWPINNDVRGGYYRMDYRRARWSWNTGIDRIESISGDGFEGWYGNAFVRYQASPRLGYGGGVSARDGASNGSSAQTLQLYLDTRSRWGQTRLQYDTARDGSGSDSWQVLADHALHLRQGWRLSVSAGFGELANGGARPASSTSLATYGGFDLSDNVSIDGTVRWTRGGGGEDARGLDLNLGGRWRIAQRWSLLGNISENRGNRRSPFVLDPLTNQPVFESLPHDRTMQVSLRYDFGAGHSRPVLGGPANAATGRISGSVFLDDNGDGIRSASERPAANITITLDGRYTVRTDDLGRFEFDRVAVGSHMIDVISDNLPLPWFVDAARARQQIQVDVRGESTVEIGAERSR